MISIIVVGHGHFASGILSSLELIAGKQEKVFPIDFTAGMSAEEIRNKLSEVLNTKEKTLILCDLLGGTPFKVSVTLMEENPKSKINVLAGLNLSMLIETCFARHTENSLDDLVTQVLAISKEGICDWKSLSTRDNTISEDEEEI